MWCYYILLSFFVCTNITYLVHYFVVAHVADTMPIQIINDFGSRICKLGNSSEPVYWKYSDENAFNITSRSDWIIGYNKLNGKKLYTTDLMHQVTDAIAVYIKTSKTDNYGKYLPNSDCFTVNPITTNTWVVTTYLFYLIGKFIILFVFNWVATMCCRSYAPI